MTAWKTEAAPDKRSERLRAYAAMRDALMERAIGVAKGDSRIVAAWIFGSLGRGEADALSDIDIFVVAGDTAAAEVIAHRRDHIRQLGEPLLVLEAPQNAPPHGAYNMALYPGEYGPHQVDWYWQPQSHARIPQQTRLLFDRAGLPHLDGPPHFEYQPAPERDPLDAMAQTVNFCWMMLLIAAKYAVRPSEDSQMDLVPWGALEEIERFLVATPAGPPDTAQAEAALPGVDLRGLPEREPAGKLSRLQDLAGQLEPLMPLLARRGVVVPHGMGDQAASYFQTVAAAL